MKPTLQSRCDKSTIRFAVAAVVCLFLISCSSNNDDATPSTGPDGNTLIGRFVDSPVSGLAYMTSSGLSGSTNAAGEFKFLPEDVVTFSVGVLEIGSIKGASRITPFDLVGFELPGASLALDDLAGDIFKLERGDVNPFSTGVNLLIFLQSLDQNNDADDGIEITAAVIQFFTLSVTSLLFDQNTDDFVEAFLILFVQLVTGGLLDRNPADEPVDSNSAIAHFVQSNF